MYFYTSYPGQLPDGSESHCLGRSEKSLKQRKFYIRQFERSFQRPGVEPGPGTAAVQRTAY